MSIVGEHAEDRLFDQVPNWWLCQAIMEWVYKARNMRIWYDYGLSASSSDRRSASLRNCVVTEQVISTASFCARNIVRGGE
jgi:hypothetical protein